MSTGEGVDAADLELVRRATEIVDRCGDGRVHTVAAAARAGDGLIVTGVNLYHFTGGPCAEMVLLGNAAELGVGPLEAIVAVADRTRGSPAAVRAVPAGVAGLSAWYSGAGTGRRGR